MSNGISLKPGSRVPHVGDVIGWAGDGWEAQPMFARPQRETHVHTDTLVRMAMGETRSPNFVSGSAGWCIYPDGSAEFNDVVVRGTIYADAGEIGGWTIQEAYLAKDTGTDATSVGLAPADYPFYAGATYANRASAPFRVTPAGMLTATNAYITGELVAGGGEIKLLSTGMYVNLGTGTPGPAIIRFEDFDGTYDFSTRWWTYTTGGSTYSTYIDHQAATSTYTAAYLQIQARIKSGSVYAAARLQLQTGANESGLYGYEGGSVLVGTNKVGGTGWVPYIKWLASGDIQARLQDSAGANKFSILDSGNTEVARITSVGEVYGRGDDRGLMDRVANKGFTVYDHFNDSTVPAWGSWAGAPFGGAPSGTDAENTESSSVWHINPGDDETGTKIFYYHALGALTTPGWLRLRGYVELVATVGLRIDDGSDNNYVEYYIESASATTANVQFAYRVGGGAVTTTAAASGIEKVIFRVLYLGVTGTAWTNWTATGRFGIDSEAYTNSQAGLTWTPARLGVFFLKTANGSGRGAHLDWYGKSA